MAFADIESGSRSGTHSGEFFDDDDGGAFGITNTKNAIVERLKRWRAVLLSQKAGAIEYLDVQHGDYGVTQEELTSMSKGDLSDLYRLGGVNRLAEKLKSNLEKGISGDEEDMLQRKYIYGSNTYPRKKGQSFWRFLWEACQDWTLKILLIAGLAFLAFGIISEGDTVQQRWYEGGSILFAVVLINFVTAIGDYRQYLQFQSLIDEKRHIHLKVVRGSRIVWSSISDIVVGDIVPLEIGDQVPADGVLIPGHSLAINESSITGESKIVTKDSKTPFLMSGCKVEDGYGTMLVTSVGVNTEWGMLMASILEDTGEETSLQVRLNGIATFIGIAGSILAFVVLSTCLARYFTGHTYYADGTPQFQIGKTSAIHAIKGAIRIVTVGVTIAMVAVPEGLPLAVTLTLAYSMRKMMRDKALLQRLSACETMGSATTICTDKTGMLTLNQMTVVEAYANRKLLDPTNDVSQLSPKLSSLLIECIAQCTTGHVFQPEGGGDVESSGSPTEKAILSWGVKLGMNFNAKRAESVIISASPFKSEEKRGGVAVKRPNGEIHIHWKGAAETILDLCTSYVDEYGSVASLDEDKIASFENAIKQMAMKSLRCVAFAYRSCNPDEVPSDDEELSKWVLPHNDLVLLTIVGIKDPCRPGVKDSIELCRAAGVKVRMVTGDNIQTAKAIALECGIQVLDANLIDGKSFRRMSDIERKEIADDILVMGNSSPEDKYLLVRSLKEKGEVVAVTGGRANDAKTLKMANIGLSMGIGGTKVAKESSDIVILDDNFASIVKVVRWGRSVYANNQKFVQFQLTATAVALIIYVVVAFSTGDFPLNVVQLLWINLIMNTLGALALATEPPTDQLMRRPPISKREPIITNIMWLNVLIQVLYQLTVLLLLHYNGRNILHLQQELAEDASRIKKTVIFNAFVLCQIFNMFNSRKPDEFNIFTGIIKNHLLMVITALTLILQIMIVEFFGVFAQTVKLTWGLWLACILIGFCSWPFSAIGKLIPIIRNRSGNVRAFGVLAGSVSVGAACFVVIKYSKI